jgi:hypothetical protein
MYKVAVVLQYILQYNKINTIQYNTQNNTYTLKTIHNAIITNTITQNYKHNAHKKNRSIKQYDTRNIHMYNYPNMI